MPLVGSEPTIPASARPQTHALDGAATEIGCICSQANDSWDYRKDATDGECWARGRGEKFIYSFCLETRLAGWFVMRITLKWVWIYIIQVQACELHVFGSEHGPRLLLRIRQWTVVFHTGRRISRLAEIEGDASLFHARPTRSLWAAHSTHRLNSIYIIWMVFVALFTSRIHSALGTDERL
jgi:hypothetical protein